MFWMDDEEPQETASYRAIAPGTPANPGDEFLRDGEWIARTKDFGQEITSFHAPHRRPL